MKPGEFLPQFVAQAIIDLRKQVAFAERYDNCVTVNAEGRSLPAEAVRASATFEGIAWLLSVAECFVLPMNGEIYRSTDGGGAMPSAAECDSTIGIPAPVCAFEYYWNHKEDGEVVGNKRITLVMDRQEFCKQNNIELPVGSAGGYVISTLMYHEELKTWGLGAYSLKTTKPIIALKEDSGGYWGLECSIFDLAAQDEILDPKKGNEIVGEFFADVNVLVQVCTALRAGARTVSHVERSPTRRAKFASQGAGGIVYKTLVMPGDKQYDGIPSAATGGTHASPRHHFRRGHIRQLPTGALTWVRHCLVGSRESGEVLKTYKFEAVQ